MHMRTKKWAKPELNACTYYTDTPEKFRSQWHSLFDNKENPVYMELGCGKGVSTAHMVYDNQDINYIAIDIADNVLGDVRRNVIRLFGENECKNIRIVKADIEYIERCFSPEDTVDRIYISFCNPWTKREKHEKRRLTHPRQLLQYRRFMADKAQIYFKTDDSDLFRDSLAYFEKCGFAIRYITDDLHHSGFEPNYETEHERKFVAEGVPILFVIAEKLPGDFDFDAVRWHLRENKKEVLPDT